MIDTAMVRAWRREWLRPWSDLRGGVALAVIAAMVVWRVVLLQDSSFYQDDFVLTAKAQHEDLSWHFLFTAQIGHLQPFQQLVYWIVAHWFPFDWNAVAVMILATQTLCAVAMWHLLTRLLPGRWVALPLLVAFCIAPITIVPTLWWSAAMGLWPPVLFGILATTAVVGAMTDGRRGRRMAVALVCLVVALGWHEHAIPMVPMVFGVACAVAEGGVRARLSAVVRRLWPLGAGLLLAGVGYAITHVAAADSGGGAGFGKLVGVGWAYVARNFLPGVLSGPWQVRLSGGAVDPSLWSVVVAILLAVTATAWAVRAGGSTARWALVTLVGYVLVDLTMLLTARAGYGSIIGLDPRYSADLIMPAVVCAALACREMRWGPVRDWLGGSADASRFPAGARWAAVTAVVYTLGAAVTTAHLVPHFQYPRTRAYVDTFRAATAADPGAVVLDALVPDFVVLPLSGEDALLSHVFAPLPERPAFDQTSTDLRVVDDEGRLQPVQLAAPVTAIPGKVRDCGYAVKNAPRSIRLVGEVTDRAVVRIDYFTDDDGGTMSVAAAGWSRTFTTEAGPHTVWLVVPRLPAPLKQITVHLARSDTHTVCVPVVQAGWPAGD